MEAEVLMELKVDGTANAAYTYGYDRISMDTGRDTAYYLYDGQGSVTSMTTERGAVTGTYRYDPYGNLTYGMPVSVNYYGYNGESTNTNTGLQYLRARYYSPETGTFTSEDTYAGVKTSPLTMNRYIYVTNNPVNYIDPTGHSPLSKIKSVAQKAFQKTSSLVKKGASLVKKGAALVVKGAKAVVSAARTGVKTVVSSVTGAASKAATAVKQAAKNISSKSSSSGGKQSAASSSANTMKSSATGFSIGGKTYSSFASFVSQKTTQIKETVKREMCSSSQAKVSLSPSAMIIPGTAMITVGAAIPADVVMGLGSETLALLAALGAIAPEVLLIGGAALLAYYIVSEVRANKEESAKTEQEEEENSDSAEGEAKVQLPDNTTDAGKKGSKDWRDARKKIKEGKGKGINVETGSQEEAEELLKEARPSLEKQELYSNNGKSGYEIHPAEPSVGNNKPHIKWWDWSNGKANGASGHIYFD